MKKLTENVRGRDLYMKYRRIIELLAWFAKHLPKNIAYRLLRFDQNSDSKKARLVRYLALRSLAAECGELVDIHSQCQLLAPAGLSVGSRVSIHPTCYIDATGGIRIGSDVSIAHQTTILSTEHTWTRPNVPIRDQPLSCMPTSIGDNVWIGAGSRILAGVTIGSNSIIAAGSVVTRDVAENSLVAGVPARYKKSVVGLNQSSSH